MFHRVENAAIAESVSALPRSYEKDGVLHPLRALWDNGHEAEVNALGWFQEIPTAKPEGDVVSLGQPVLVDGIPTQTWEVRSFTGEELLERISQIAQEYMDDFARARNYDDMKSLVSYVGDTDPVFAAEAAYGKQMRSQIWVTLRQIKEDVLTGQRPVPTITEVMAELPQSG